MSSAIVNIPITGRHARSARVALLTALLTAAALAAGCGGGGVPRYDISGKVTFNGSPVPAGVVIFEPALDQGVDGLQGIAEIRDGRYGTKGQKKGISGGRYHVRIRGYTRPATGDERPRKLFEEYHETVDFPKEPTQRDFEVPASLAARGGEVLPPPE